MEELTASTASAFLERFCGFYDALVREAQLHFMTKHSSTRATVVVSVQDSTTVANEGWVNVTFEMEDVIAFRLLEGRSTRVVLSGGLKIGVFDGKIHLDFSPYVEEPESVEEHERSDFLVVCERCAWSVSPYDEGS